jgi:hypothetical protein
MMAYYAQHNSETTEADREHRRREVEFDTTMVEMEQWINCLLVRIQVCRRNGPSKDILKGIEEAGSEFTTRLDAIMGSAKATPFRLAAPTKNRY